MLEAGSPPRAGIAETLRDIARLQCEDALLEVMERGTAFPCASASEYVRDC